MKLVINTCFGGFSLSPLAVQELATKQGKECYFFTWNTKVGESKYVPITLKGATELGLFWTAYSVSDPENYRLYERGEDGTLKEANERSDQISLNHYADDRTNPDLVEVVERLGKLANGKCGDLKVIEIPNGVEYEIDDYDGLESVHEKHRSWS